MKAKYRIRASSICPDKSFQKATGITARDRQGFRVEVGKGTDRRTRRFQDATRMPYIWIVALIFTCAQPEISEDLVTIFENSFP